MVQTFMIYLISYVKSYVNIAYQDKCLTPSFAKHQPPAIKKANGMSKPKQPTYTSNRRDILFKKLREKCRTARPGQLSWERARSKCTWAYQKKIMLRVNLQENAAHQARENRFVRACTDGLAARKHMYEKIMKESTAPQHHGPHFVRALAI